MSDEAPWVECYLEVHGSEICAVEAGSEDDPPQGLRVHIGPVFSDRGVIARQGVWILYQDKFGHSPLQGPVLLTPEVWHGLNAAVERKLRKPRRLRILRGFLR